MADQGNGGNHLEAELRELDGVSGAYVLRDPAGKPIEVQIFSKTGSSAARIRNAVGEVLTNHKHELGPESISVFELAAVPIAGPWTGDASGDDDGKGEQVETPTPTIIPTKQPRYVPVASLLTTGLAIVGLLLLLTAPWIALTRLISEPLEQAPTASTPKVGDRATGAASGNTRQPPITVTLEPTPPQNEALVPPGPPAPAGARSRLVRVRVPTPISPSLADQPAQSLVTAGGPPAASAFAPTPTIPPPDVTTPPAVAAPPTRGRTPPTIRRASDDDSDDEEDADDDNDDSRRKTPKVVGFIPPPPGHERHHERKRNGKASGLTKHKHLRGEDGEDRRHDGGRDNKDDDEDDD